MKLQENTILRRKNTEGEKAVSLEKIYKLLYSKTLRSLNQMGNQLTDNEKNALKKAATCVIESFIEQKRIAIPLPTGFGKSTLILSLVWLIQKYQLDQKLLICVASDKEVKEIIVTMRILGITPATAGINMSSSYQHGEWDTTDITEKQVLFITHSRIYSANTYGKISALAEDRVVLWDESAQTTAGQMISGRDLRMQITEYLRHHPSELLASVLEKLDYVGEYLIPEELATISTGTIHRKDEALRTLRDNAGAHSSIQKDEYGNSVVIQVRVQIPEEINCIIFDASAQISKTAEYDKTIKLLDVKVSRDYSNCKIICVHMKTGKSSLMTNDYIDQQVAIIKELTEDTSSLLVLTNKSFQGTGVFKGKSFDIPSRVKETGASCLTWGSERGVNEFRDKSIAANIGLLHLPPEQLTAEYVAVTRNMVTEPPRGSIHDFAYRRHLGEIHQGFSRTNIRTSVDGKAKPTTLILITFNARRMAEDLRREVYPGINIALYQGDLDSIAHKRETAVMKIVSYLEPFERDKISIKKLKLAAELPEMSKRQWGEVRKRLEEELFFPWKFEGRSMVRE